MRSRLLIASLLLVPGLATGQNPRRREPAAPADAASVDAIVSALYASVSHGPDTSPDFDRMRGIFLYVGMLVPPKRAGEDFTVMDVDAFAERYQKAVAARKEKGTAATGFFEREIARRTDCFGNICQIFSTYESRHAPGDAKPFERGVNSIQLLRDGSRWWIASVVWDAERPENPIPADYLPAAKP
ncbi:MAG TPA: hypothetical protein VGK86_12395 [Thermoanaerobaculia bacterium]|jgi:hypothetical protein